MNFGHLGDNSKQLLYICKYLTVNKGGVVELNILSIFHPLEIFYTVSEEIDMNNQ